MKPIASNRILMLSLSAMLAVSVQSASAITLFWDGTDTTAIADGGAGAWNTSTLNWDDAATAGADAAWPATGLDNVATFDILAGEVVIDPAGVAANSVAFKIKDYLVSGGPLTLNGTAPGVTTSVAGALSTIAANLLGTGGLTYVGAGTLALSGDNSGLTGLLDISGNAGGNNSGVQLLNDTAIGGLASVVIKDKSFLGLAGVTLGSGVAITVSGGGGTTAPPGALRNVSGNSVVNGPVSVATNTVRFSNVSGAAGSLTINGAITTTDPAFGVFLRNNDGQGIILTNPLNSWSGTTDLAQGSPMILPAALPATANLYIGSVLGTDFGTSGTFTRAFGTGPGQVRFGKANDAARANGFSARGGDLTVNIGGAAADLKFIDAFAKTGATTTALPTVTVTDGSSILAGMSVTGTGIPTDTLVSAVAGTTVTLNKNATATAAAVALNFYGALDNTRLNSSILVLNGANGTGKTSLRNPLDLNGFSRTVNNGAAESFISGGVKNTAPATAGLTVTGAGNTTVDSLIENGSGGAVSLGKSGTGTLFLTQDNTFTGGVTFTGGSGANIGVIRLSAGGALGPGTKTINMITSTGNARGAIELTNNITVAAKNLQVGGRSGGPSFANLRNVSGNNSWTGTLTISGPGGTYSLENVQGQLTLGGTITNAVGNSSRVITFFGDGDTIINGTYKNTGTALLGLTKRGVGTLTLRSANDYSAGTIITEGSVVAQRTTQVALGTGDVSVAAGANVTITDHAGGGQLPYTNNFTLAGSGIAGGGALGFFNSGAFDVTGTLAIAGGVTIRTDPNNQAANSNITFTNAISGTGGLTLFGQGGAAGGTPRFTLTGASGYTGDTVLTSSGVNTTPFTVTLSGGDNRLPVTTNLIVGGPPAGGPIGPFDRTVTLALVGISQEFASISTANAPATAGGYRVVGAGATDATLVINNATAASFDGVIGGAGINESNIGLTKKGAGSFTLSGAQSYAGNTTVSEGNLTVDTASFDDGSQVTIASGATLTLTHGATDVVNTLLVGAGPALPDGVYTAGSPQTAGFILGSGSIQVIGGSAYDTFVAVVANPADRGPNSDPDKDGIRNAVEFVIGGNPASGNDSALLPTQALVMANLGNGSTEYLKFVFRRTAASAYLAPGAEYDTDLAGAWTPATNGVNGVVVQTAADPNDANVDDVSVYIPRSLAENGRLFARLRVEVTP